MVFVCDSCDRPADWRGHAQIATLSNERDHQGHW